MPLTDLDRKLLDELLSGDSGAWKLFVDRFNGLIIQIIQQTARAHSLRVTTDDVDDLCADTFAELLVRDMAALRGFRGRCSLATYLAVISRRIVVRRLTQDRFRQAMGHVNAHHAAVSQTQSGNSEQGRVDDRDELESLMSRLPGGLRTIAAWFFLDQLSYREIASRLKRPVNSIGPIVARIRDEISGTRRHSN